MDETCTWKQLPVSILVSLDEDTRSFHVECRKNSFFTNIAPENWDFCPFCGRKLNLVLLQRSNDGPQT